jgi:ABC-type branched-subunit amino acid transport system substrate-binding protein
MVDFAGGLEPGFGPYLEQQKVPLIGPSWTEFWGTTLGHKYVYEVDASLPTEFITQFAVAKALGGTKVGAIGEGTNFDKLWAYGAQLYGLQWYKDEQTLPTAPSFAAPCLALQQGGVNVLLSPFGDLTVKQIVDQCAAQGYHPIIIGQSATTNPDWLTDSNFVKAGGSISSFPWFQTSVPAIATFNQVMQKYDPAALTSTPAVTSLAWASMMVFEGAAKAANLGTGASGQQVITGLNTITNNNFGGLTPTLTYANGGNLQLPNCSWLIAKVGTAFQVANNGQRECIPYSEVLQGFGKLST